MNIDRQLELGKEEVALRIMRSVSSTREFAHIEIQVVYVDRSKGTGMESMGFYDNYFHQKHQYRRLFISCQMSADIDKPYAHHLTVNDGSKLTLQQAEAAIKVLRPIHRKLDKLTAAHGTHQGFEGFVLRVAQALGVKSFYRCDDRGCSVRLEDGISGLTDHISEVVGWSYRDIGRVTAAA